MLARLRPTLQQVYFVEAALMGVFTISALRYLIGMLYSRVAGAAVVSVTDPALVPAGAALPDPAAVANEVALTVYLLFLPLLAVVFGRARLLFVPTVALVAAGRLLIHMDAVSPTVGAALAVGGGWLYVALLVRQRATLVPYFFVMGMAVDQLFRAAGNTLDLSWAPGYVTVQSVLSTLAIVVALAGWLAGGRARREESGVSPERGLLPVWGGVGMGALLFVQLALLGMPNAIAGRASVDYTLFVPLVSAATILPLVPWVRGRARAFITVFDGTVRGWAWLIFMALLLVFGLRFPGIGGGAALVAMQFGMTLLWWWLARPQAERERNFTGVWVIVGVLVFVVLVAADFFTYEYAFVRNFAGNLEFLNTIVPPLLRGFRGLGLGVLLLATFCAVLPMTQSPRRVPWGEPRTTPLQSAFALVLLVGFVAGSAWLARPPLVIAERGESFRVGTYNIHAGFSEFFVYDLSAIASTIQVSGAQVVMLQEVEAGRLTSFGVDQPLWLARALGMDRRFFPTNEGLQGLATLSRVPVVFHRGNLLNSAGNQTGVQHTQVSVDGVSAISFYNTWLGLLLELPGERSIGEQEQDQQRQLAELFTIIARDFPDLSRVRLVVGGTFNNVPGSPLIEQMRVTGFSDPFAGRPLELSATLWRTNLRARIDYLWTRNLAFQGAGVPDSAASDHRIAVIEIALNRAG